MKTGSFRKSEKKYTFCQLKDNAVYLICHQRKQGNLGAKTKLTKR